MKKLLSFILAVCMLAALMPVMSVSAVENPKVYTYDVGHAEEGRVVPVTDLKPSYHITSGTNGYWKYYGMSDSFKTVYDADTGVCRVNDYNPCLQMGFNAVGQYVQLMLWVRDTEPKYFIPTINYFKSSGSNNMKVYIAPETAANPVSEEYFVGSFNPYANYNNGGSATLGGFMTDGTEQDYIVTFLNDSTGGGHNFQLSSVVFTESDIPMVEYTYELGWSQQTNAVREVPDVTDYVAKSGTNGEWKYYGMSEGFKSLHDNTYSGTLRRTFEVTQPNNYMNIGFNAPGQYAGLMIKVPKTDTYYTPKFTYRSGSGSNAVKVYIAPKTAINPRSKEYLKGIFNAYEKYSTGDTITLETFKSDTTETEYILIFENASTGTGNNLSAISLVLSETEETEIKPVDEAYAFNFIHATAGIGIPTLDTYEKTLRNWKYCNMESSLKATYDAGGTAARTLAGCLNIVPGNANGQWLSLTLDNISKGTYDITFDYATHKNGGIGDVYLAPASVSESARTNAEYKIGTIDYYEADTFDYKKVYTAKLLKTTLKESGDYVITFKHTGGKSPAATGYQMNPVNLKLCETTPDAASGSAVSDTFANVSVLAENGGTVSAEGYNTVDEVKIGTAIKATATPNEGYTFAYWRNAAGKHLSSSATETFVINTNTAVIAVFDKIANPNDTEAPVYFYNENGSLLDSKKVAKGTSFADAKIENPTLTGYAFDKWSVADDTIINTLTRAVALYKESDATYTVKVGDSVVASDKKYEEFVTVTSNNNNFSYWMIGENIVSYDKSFTFRVYGNVVLTEVCEGAKKAQPTVALDVIGDNYFIGYTVPAGYTKIEAGIIFGDGFTPTVASFHSKASEKTGSGQFTAKSSGDGETIARGYLIFKTTDGSIRVIYAD